MATLTDLEALSAQLRDAYQLAWNDITAEQARIASDPAKFARRARLREMQAAINERLDQVDEQARAWLTDEFPAIYRSGAETAAGALAEAFQWNTIDADAVASLASDTFGELLAASDGVAESTKALIRRLGKEQSLLKAAAGKTAPQAARDLRRLLEQNGIYSVRYRNGSKHGLAEYTDMLLRTKTAVASNSGALNFGRRAGTGWVEVFDGFGCGWSSHTDPDLANGSIRSVEEASNYTISHPRCRRSFGPRPDISTAAEARQAQPSTTAAQRADQAAAERAQAAAVARKAATRRRQESATARRVAERERKAAARAARRTEADARRRRPT